MSFESQLQNAMTSSKAERTFIDKLLAKEDIARIRDLQRKKNLSREELLELLYMLTGAESKLYKLNDWERYIILKYFVWIREFIKVIEKIHDYKDQINKKGLTPTAKKAFDNVISTIEHDAKFLVDIYLNIGRTSLSVEGKAFEDLLANKFEMTYDYRQPQQTTPQNNVRN